MHKPKIDRVIKNLFHDQGDIYLSNIEPKSGEKLTLRLKALKGVAKEVFLCISENGADWTDIPMSFEKDDISGKYELYVTEITVGEVMFKYHFKLKNAAGEELFYSRTYLGEERPTFDEIKLDSDNCWTLIPNYKTPDWAKGVIWYSVMPDAFYNGDIMNDEPTSGVNLSNPWSKPQHSLQYKYGGDLLGIEKKLDYIKSLGCEAVFMDPIFKSSQNAGYGPEFYKQIENSFGNAKSLETLARAVHDRDMKYMIDVVFAFVAVRDIWYNQGNVNPKVGAFEDWESEFHDFFHFKGEKGNTKDYVSSWGGLALNHANEKLCDLLYRDEDSYLQYYCNEPFNVDAIRYDCGGALYGIDKDGKRVPHEVVVGKMRPYLKKINPDIMTLSEYSMYYAVDKGVWDSRWNLEFARYAIKYIKGEFSESLLFERIDNEMHNIPRAFGLCQYTSVSDHDRPRIKDCPEYAFYAYQLIQMTEVCAPCIYYGDEIKIERETGSFYAMEWEETNWDYRRLGRTKALTELRKAHPATRNGVIKYLVVSDEERLISFARMKGEDIVITVASRNPFQKSLLINTADLGAPDGTLFTDWLTGRQFVSKNGYVELTVEAGGSVFTNGGDTASYMNGYEVANIGNINSKVIAKSPEAFELTSKGGNLDNITFIGHDVFNTASVSAFCRSGGALMLRSDNSPDSPFAAATVGKNSLSLYVRKTRGAKVKRIFTCGFSPDSCLKLQRNPNGSLSLYTEKTVGAEPDKIFEGGFVNLLSHIKAGVCGISGRAIFEDIKLESNNILSAELTSPTAFFDYNENAQVTFKKEGMRVKGSESFLTNLYKYDWTFKADISLKSQNEGAFAGIISEQDKASYVLVGRMIRKGAPILFIGKASGGHLAVLHSAPDPSPKKTITIQLQRIGTAYSAVYKSGSKWKPLGESIVANLCHERAGLAVSGEAVFKNASFGNAICDSESVNTPHTPEIKNASFDSMNNTLTIPKYRFLSGEWDYANEGYIQKSHDLSAMVITNKIYCDFKVDGTYLIDEGDGFVGFEFSKKRHDTPLGDGILVSLSSEGELKVSKGDTVYASEMLGVKIGESVKISTEYRKGTLALYVGEDSKPAIILENFEADEGYLTYFTKGVVGHINNSLAASNDAEFVFGGEYERFGFNDMTAKKTWGHTEGYISQFGIAVTDFVASAKFEVGELKGEGKEVGFKLCTPEAKFTPDVDISLYFDANYRLTLKKQGKVLASAMLRDKSSSTELIVVKKDGKLTVYAEGYKTPIMENIPFTQNGGVVSLWAKKIPVKWSDFKLMNLNETDLPTKSPKFRSLMKYGK